MFIDYVQHGDYTVSQAKAAAADILFNNSNRLYKLQLTPQYNAESNEKSLATVGQKGAVASDALDIFLQANPKIEYVWMQWVDYTATVRVRMFPLQEFIRIARNERRIGIALAALSMLQNDVVIPEGSTTGQFYMQPDFSSLYLNGSMVTPAAPSATVMAFWKTEDGQSLEGCPRGTLQNIVEKLHKQHNINVLCGFEVEVVFLKSEKERTTCDPAATIHSWSQMTTQTRRMVPILEEITQALVSMGIKLQQFHAESSPGQFEFVLPPLAPLAAVDTLIATRQVISAVADRHGLRATLHPRPYPGGAGTASHTHISINPPTKEDAFLAGMLDHFRSIVAFTLSQEASYERVRSGIWAGSEWVAWGFQNREVPIRKISPGHWEIKSMDGLANPYFAVAALLAGGYLGLEANAPLTVKECGGKSPSIIAPYCNSTDFVLVDASTLSESQRSELGITTQIPKSLDESLVALENDKALQNLLGPGFVRNYTLVKRAESASLSAMSEAERRLWVVERY